MFENLNGWEFIVLALLGLFIFGPDRLPKVINDAMRMVRGLRDMARNATNDLSREMGTEVRLEDLHPKTFIRKHLLSEEDERTLRRPFDDMYRDVQQLSSDVTDPRPPAPRQDPPGYDTPGYDAPGHDASRYDPPRYDSGSGQPRYEQSPSYDPSRAAEGEHTGQHRTYDADAT